jgi:hypothetical protein
MERLADAAERAAECLKPVNTTKTRKAATSTGHRRCSVKIEGVWACRTGLNSKPY